LQDIIVDMKVRLQKHPACLPAWLYVNSDAIPGIVDALDFWSTTEQSTSQMLRDHAECTGPDLSALLNDPLVSPAYKKSIRIGIQAQRREAYNLVNTLSDEEMVRGGFVQPGQSLAQATREVARNKDAIVDRMLEGRKEGTWPCRKQEEEWYKITKVFPPPPSLRDRHAGFESYDVLRKTELFPVPSQQKVCNH